MDSRVGIYRGSFDPPHNGHLEVVTCALQNGISPITIIYEDPNRHKPFRSSNEIRRKFLITMFVNMPNVNISNKSYKAVMSDLLADSTITKIFQIIGSDLLLLPVRPIKTPRNLAYFIHDRGDVSLEGMQSWNGLPIEIAFANRSIENPSSTKIRNLLQEREFQKAKSYFPIEVFNEVISENVYVPTENEFPYRHILQQVKKILEKQISAEKLISEENYPLSFQLGKDIGISGLSGDLICFISDKNQKKRLVVKVFLNETYLKNYESELLGYRIISDLNLKYIKVPTLFLSEAHLDFAFICMSYCEGKSLVQMMDTSDETVQLCAKANLELHLAKRVMGDVLPEQLALFDKILPKVLSKLNVDFLAQKVKLSDHWLKLREAFIVNPGLRSFTHGDPNHSNCFVDLEKQKVTYIDLSLFSRSVHHEDTPCGFAINEFEESLLTFKIAAKKLGLSDERTKAIQRIYESAYWEDAPSDLITRDAKQFFSAYWNLRVLENVLDKLAATQSLDMQLKYQLQVWDIIQKFLNPLYEDKI